MIFKERQRLIILINFMLAHAINDGFRWVIPPLLPAIRDHFHLSYAEVGLFYTFFEFIGDSLQVLAAYLVYLLSPTVIITSGLLWASIWMFIASLSNTYMELLWISMVSGIGRATYHPLAMSILSRIFPKESFGRVVGLHLSGSSIGQMVAPFLVGFLLSYFGWRFPIQMWSVLGLLASVALFFSLQYQKENFLLKAKTPKLPFFSRPMGIYLIGVSVWSIAQTGLNTFLPLYLVDCRGFNTRKAAVIYGIMSLSGIMFRPLVGALMDWMGRRKPVVIGGFIIAGLSILILIKTETLWLMYLSLVLLGIFGTGHAGLSDTLMIEMIPPHRREETLGFVYTVRMGTASLSPLIVGYVSGLIGLNDAFLIMASVPIFTASIIVLAEEKPMRWQDEVL